MSNEYQKIVCTITNEECEWTDCTGCETIKTKEKEEKESYNFTNEIKVKGHSYNSNHVNTVVKFTSECLEETIIDFGLKDSVLVVSIDDEYLEIHYPEWIRTREYHDIKETPNHYLFLDEKNPLIVVFQDVAYVVAPRHEE